MFIKESVLNVLPQRAYATDIHRGKGDISLHGSFPGEAARGVKFVSDLGRNGYREG